MTAERYTGILSEDTKVLFKKHHPSIAELQASIIAYIHCSDYGNARGEIIDNHTGEIVQTFYRQTSLE
jgi:hypothetical protein